MRGKCEREIELARMTKQKPSRQFDQQHAVLDPDNFSRFDDPLLHSCLWRAATSSELDWSSSLEMSNTCKSFMLRQMAMNYNGDENTMLDLFIGIACGKIQRSKRCVIEIIDTGYVAFDNQAIVELLKFIDIHIANRASAQHLMEF